MRPGPALLLLRRRPAKSNWTARADLRQRGRGISVAATPERGAVVHRAKELVAFARHHGYRVDELVRIIEEVS